MNDVIKNMIERRSIKKYKDEQIKKEDLELILEAGKYAANGMGLQSPVMVVLQEKEVIKKYAKMNAAVMGMDKDPFYGAPTVVIVLADKNRGTCIEDGSLVIGNMMNAAHSLGIGSCWIHRAYQVFESDEGKAMLKEWGIEGEYRGIGNCILGYMDGEYPVAKDRKENYVYYVK
ncbi:MAG: nitroreductase [Bacilli bacterium]|nr:nitroreductase [Bacilli bacterium]